MRHGVLLIALALTVACSPATSELDEDRTWVGTITTEGNVTTVVNESGSVWGGTARLVEELSIGVESGAAEAMFGRIRDVYADDRGIYVIDGDVPVVRMYDPQGNHVRDLGRHGQGPGEYGSPIQVGAAPDGRVFVVDQSTRRINVYGPDGEALADVYPIEGRAVCCNQPLYIDPRGTPWFAYQAQDPTAPGALQYTIRAHGPDGVLETREVPTSDFTPPAVSFNGRDFAVPFAAHFVWNLSRSGDVVVGKSDRYRFEIHKRDRGVIAVEKYWDPVPVGDAESRYFRDVWMGQRLAPPGWDGDEIPEHKAAFFSFWGSSSGDIWVLRPGPGIRDPACAEPGNNTLCWKDSFLIDAFDADGRFLATVELPEELRGSLVSVRPFRHGDRVVAVAMDDADTIMVKRYRLVPPGAGEMTNRPRPPRWSFSTCDSITRPDQSIPVSFSGLEDGCRPQAAASGEGVQDGRATSPLVEGAAQIAARIAEAMQRKVEPAEIVELSRGRKYVAISIGRIDGDGASGIKSFAAVQP